MQCRLNKIAMRYSGREWPNRIDSVDVTVPRENLERSRYSKDTKIANARAVDALPSDIYAIRQLIERRERQLFDVSLRIKTWGRGVRV